MERAVLTTVLGAASYMTSVSRKATVSGSILITKEEKRLTHHLICRVGIEGYTFIGTGWCIDDSKDDDEIYFPSLYKHGALLTEADHEMELKEMCDKYPDCVGIDLYNDDNGYLLFRSVAALDEIAEPGWDKWSPSWAMEEGVCIADDCSVTASEMQGSGGCYAKNSDT